MSTASEAHILVTLPGATLTSSATGTLTGPLALEYVTFDIPNRDASTSTSPVPTRDVLLVLRLGDGSAAFEAPLDPARALTVTAASSGAQRYVFHATPDDAEFVLELPATPDTADDVELFHSVLVGYAADVRAPAGEAQQQQQQHLQAATPARARSGADQSAGAPPMMTMGAVGPGEDLRGRFVLMNEDDGEIVGALDGSVRVHEDPSLGEKGHEQDPVVVELPEGADTLDDLRDIEVLVRTVPPEDRDWMLKGAVFASHAISGTTRLLTSAMTSASNYYIAHSTPSTTTSTAASPTPGGTPSSSSKAPTPPPHTPPPSRTLLLLQSPTTRKHLTRIHTVSGGAVKLSNKAVTVVERLIERAVVGGGGGANAGKDKDKGKGRAIPSSPAIAAPSPRAAVGGGGTDAGKDKGKGRAFSPSPGIAAPLPQQPAGKPPLPPRSRGPSPAQPGAYSYNPNPSDTTTSTTKPPLPPRHDKSPSSAGGGGGGGSRSPSPKPPLRTSARVALSASLVLASLAASTVRLVDAGGAAVSAAVTHKYGAAAGSNVALAGRTARNVVLVYVDVRGLGRRAIVKHTAKTWAKGQVARHREHAGPRR